MMRDVGLAEELAQDALVAALEQWPESGKPEKAGRMAHGDREAQRHRCACGATRSIFKNHWVVERYFLHRSTTALGSQAVPPVSFAKIVAARNLNDLHASSLSAERIGWLPCLCAFDTCSAR